MGQGDGVDEELYYDEVHMPDIGNPNHRGYGANTKQTSSTRGGEKAFRVTNNAKNRNLNLINQHKNTLQQAQQKKSLKVPNTGSALNNPDRYTDR